MKVDNNTQMASVASKLLASPLPLPLQSRTQATDTGSSRSDMVTLSKRAQEALEEIRRLAAEDAAAKRGQTLGSDAAVVSLRLNTARPARLDGTVSGSARVGLGESGAGSNRIVSFDVVTGEGDDEVSISAAGGFKAQGLVLTNGGDDTIDLEGGMGVIADGGAGDDVIRSEGNEGRFNGGSGADTLELKNVSGLIGGGAGSDQINLSWDQTAGTARRYFAKGETGGVETWTKDIVVKENVAIVSFKRGGGHDVVTTTTAPEADALGAADIWMYDLSASEVEAKRDGKDLVLRVKDTGDSLTLRDYDPGAWKLIRFLEGEKSLADLVKDAQ